MHRAPSKIPPVETFAIRPPAKHSRCFYGGPHLGHGETFSYKIHFLEMFLRGRGGAPVETFGNVSTGAYGANVSTGPRCGPPAKHFRKMAPVKTLPLTRGQCFYGGSLGPVETFFVSTGGGIAGKSSTH